MADGSRWLESLPILEGLVGVGALQRFEVGEQIFQLLLADGLVEGWHHLASENDAVGDVLIGGWKSAGKVLPLVEFLEAGSLGGRCVVGVVAARALCVEYPTSAGLLLVESELSVGFATLDGAGHERQDERYQQD